MPTNLQNLSYPFDSTGSLVSNKITGEQQILTGANSLDYYFIIPKLGPYFSTSLVVSFRSLTDEVRLLVEGIDYYCTHWFISASRATATPIYGSITFLDLQLTGVVTLQYQTLGGVWTIDDTTIAQILGNILHNPRVTAWDVVSNMPVNFPPINHEWDLVDLVGASDIIASLGLVEDAIRQRTLQNNSTTAIGVKITTINNAVYNVLSTDATVLCNSSSSAQLIKLPDAASVFNDISGCGQVFNIKKIDATANTVTILCKTGELMDGESTVTIYEHNDSFNIQSTRAGWVIL